jgi:hypothetical protein
MSKIIYIGNITSKPRSCHIEGRKLEGVITVEISMILFGRRKLPRGEYPMKYQIQKSTENPFQTATCNASFIVRHLTQKNKKIIIISLHFFFIFICC